MQVRPSGVTQLQTSLSHPSPPLPPPPRDAQGGLGGRGRAMGTGGNWGGRGVPIISCEQTLLICSRLPSACARHALSLSFPPSSTVQSSTSSRKPPRAFRQRDTVVSLSLSFILSLSSRRIENYAFNRNVYSLSLSLSHQVSCGLFISPGYSVHCGDVRRVPLIDESFLLKVEVEVLITNCRQLPR